MQLWIQHQSVSRSHWQYVTRDSSSWKDTHICGHYITGEGLPADLRGTQASVITSSHSQTQRRGDTWRSALLCSLLSTNWSSMELIFKGCSAKHFIYQELVQFDTNQRACEDCFLTWRKLGGSLNRWPPSCLPPLQDTAAPQEVCGGFPACNYKCGSGFDEESKVRTSKSAWIKLRSPFKCEHARGTSL